MIENSFIYTGEVIHKRFKPKEHFFKYSVFSLFIDLNEIRFIDKKIPFFSYNKFNVLSFFDKDHGERDGSDLGIWVGKKLKEDLNEKDFPLMFSVIECICENKKLEISW